MIGPMDFVLGGLAPLAAAAAAFALAWFATRRGAAAWSAGVVVGYAAGALALDARGAGLAAAASHWIHPAESHQWLALIAVAGAIPAVGAALSGRRWVEWALAVPLCVAAPARLLWSKYRASAQLRDAGFDDNAISPGGAIAVLLALAVATLAAWWLWRRAADVPLPKTRSLLAIVAATGAAAVAALTGALVFGQLFGALAAALGGCAATAWLVGERSGPEAARGPALLLLGGLLAAAVTYSDLQPGQAAALAAALVLPVGWLPASGRLRPVGQAAVRVALCVIPLTAVVWQSAAAFVAGDDQPRETGADDVYDYYLTAPSSPGPAERDSGSQP